MEAAGASPNFLRIRAKLLPSSQLSPSMKPRKGRLSEYVGAQQRLLFQLLHLK